MARGPVPGRRVHRAERGDGSGVDRRRRHAVAHAQGDRPRGRRVLPAGRRGSDRWPPLVGVPVARGRRRGIQPGPISVPAARPCRACGRAGPARARAAAPATGCSGRARRAVHRCNCCPWAWSSPGTMRSAHKVLVVLCGAALVAIIALGLLRSSTLVYSLGVAPAVPVADLRPGQQACQGAIIVPNGTAFDRVRIALGTYRRPGPELEVVVRRAADRAPIARGRLAGGYGDFADAPWHVVPVQRVSTDDAVGDLRREPRQATRGRSSGTRARRHGPRARPSAAGRFPATSASSSSALRGRCSPPCPSRSSARPCSRPDSSAPGRSGCSRRSSCSACPPCSSRLCVPPSQTMSARGQPDVLRPAPSRPSTTRQYARRARFSAATRGDAAEERRAEVRRQPRGELRGARPCGRPGSHGARAGALAARAASPPRRASFWGSQPPARRDREQRQLASPAAPGASSASSGARVAAHDRRPPVALEQPPLRGALGELVVVIDDRGSARRRAGRRRGGAAATGRRPRGT